MEHQSFAQGDLLVEAYDGVEFRFVRSLSNMSGEPMKHVLQFDARNFLAQVRHCMPDNPLGWCGDLDSALAGGSFPFAQGLYEAGAALAEANGISIPRSPIGHPDLLDLYYDLQFRREIEFGKLQPGACVAYISGWKESELVNLFYTGKVGYNQGALSAEIVASGYAYCTGFLIDTDTKIAHLEEIGLDFPFPVGIYMPEETDGKRNLIVPATDADIQKIRQYLPHKMDPAVEALHFQVMDTDLDALLATDMPEEERLKTMVLFLRRSIDEFPGIERYVKACEYVAMHRHLLSAPVPVFLPPEFKGHSSPRWAAVVSESEPEPFGTCRVIMPKRHDILKRYAPVDHGHLSMN